MFWSLRAEIRAELSNRSHEVCWLCPPGRRLWGRPKTSWKSWTGDEGEKSQHLCLEYGIQMELGPGRKRMNGNHKSSNLHKANSSIVIVKHMLWISNISVKLYDTLNHLTFILCIPYGFFFNFSYLASKKQVLLASLLFHLYGNDLLSVASAISSYVQNANDTVIFLPYVGVY